MLFLLAVSAGIYGLHRLATWMEDRGWIYYRKHKPTTSAASVFVAMQQCLEPQVEHVRTIDDERPRPDDDEGQGRA